MESVQEIAESMVNPARGGYKPAEVVELICKAIQKLREAEGPRGEELPMILVVQGDVGTVNM